MIDSGLNTCDDRLLNKYLDKELNAAEKARLDAHLKGCRQCRCQVATLRSFSEALRNQVDHTCGGVDFKALEKALINKVVRQRHPRSVFSSLRAGLTYTLPAVVTAGIVIFIVYTHFLAQPTPLPSAIINSFTGSVSSVMIFETPETRQTILWYKEETVAESDNDAV